MSSESKTSKMKLGVASLFLAAGLQSCRQQPPANACTQGTADIGGSRGCIPKALIKDLCPFVLCSFCSIKHLSVLSCEGEGNVDALLVRSKSAFLI